MNHQEERTGGVIRTNICCKICNKDDEMKKKYKRIIINKYKTF